MLKLRIVRRTNKTIELIDSRLENMSGFVGIGKGKVKTELM
jgi:hypothetical protein